MSSSHHIEIGINDIDRTEIVGGLARLLADTYTIGIPGGRART